MALLILGSLIFAAILVNRPTWIKVDYVVWPRTKKWIFAIICGFLPWLFANGAWMLFGIVNTFMIAFILEKQQHFISIKFRS